MEGAALSATTDMSAIGLGRKAPPDRSEDKRFLMRRVTPTVTHKLWSSYGVLDQGGTSQCVAYSGFKYLTSGPVINRFPKEKPRDIYKECLLVDEWPGEDWEGGTSVRALFKVFQRLGYVGEYRWAFDADTVVNHILTRGPVVVGTSWYKDMFTPHRSTGYITPTGSDGGGHAWLIIGAYLNRKNPDGSFGAVRMLNSWGPDWGNEKGRAWVTIKDLDILIKADGEACVASEIKISALSTLEPTANVA